MQRRINHFQVARTLGPAQPDHAIVIHPVDLFADLENLSFCGPFLIADPFHVQKRVQLLDAGHHGEALLRTQLSPIGGINLVAVVLSGIMACRDHDAAARFQVAHGKGQLRNARQLFEQIHPDAVGREHTGRFSCKFKRKSSGIVRNHCGRPGAGDTGQIIRQSLRRPADDIAVHSGNTRTDHTAQSRCPKGQVPQETVLNLRVIVPNRLQFGEQIRFRNACSPAQISFLVRHFAFPFLGLSPSGLPALFRRPSATRPRGDPVTFPEARR